MIEAISNIRLEKMERTKYRYEFDNCLNYEIDEYVVPLDMYRSVEEIDEEGEYDFD